MQGIEENRVGKVLELKWNFNENNTLTIEALTAVRDTLRQHKNDINLRVLVVSSASKAYFSNGLDPNLFINNDRDTVMKNFKVIADSSSELMNFPLPVIMMIEGHCMAMGAAYAIGCDYRFMARGSGRIGFPESRIAMNFPVISTELLKDIVGIRAARDLLYGGGAVKTSEALDIGLIDREFEPADIHAETLKFAESLSRLTVESARGMKAALRRGYDHLVDGISEWDLNAMVDTICSENAQEGFHSIVEARRPRFKDPS